MPAAGVNTRRAAWCGDAVCSREGTQPRRLVGVCHSPIVALEESTKSDGIRCLRPAGRTVAFVLYGELRAAEFVHPFSWRALEMASSDFSRKRHVVTSDTGICHHGFFSIDQCC